MLCGVTIRMSPLSCLVSPLTKCAKTSMTRYPIEINAMTLVYLRESNRLRNERGITISLIRQCQSQHSYRTYPKDSHKSSYPEPSIYKKSNATSILTKSLHNTWHKVSNNDKIADTNSKTLDRYCCIKDYRCIRIRDL